MTTNEGAPDPTAVERPCPDCGEKRSAHAAVSVCPANQDADDEASDPKCDTCSDTGRVAWMIEGDPNCYQEPDSEGMLPCPDCIDASTEASEPLTEAEREALAAAIGITTVRPSAHPKFPGGIAAAVERIVAAREADAANKARADELTAAADALNQASVDFREWWSPNRPGCGPEDGAALDTLRQCLDWLRDRAARIAQDGAR